MPHDAAVFRWILTTLGCPVAGSIIVAHEVLPAAWPRAAVGFCVAVLFQPAIYNVWHGQMKAIVFLCLALALRSWMRGDEVACGIALGAGAASKVAPVVLLVLFAQRRWWRGMAAGTATVVGSLVAGGALVGFGAVREWFTQVLPVLGRDDGWYFNQSWNALVNRLVDHNVRGLQATTSWIHPLVLVLAAVGLGTVALVVGRAAVSPDRRALEFAAAVTAMLLAGTISWYSAHIHLTIPLLVVVGLLARRERLGRPLVTAAAVCALTVGLLTPLFLGGGGKDWVVAQYGTTAWWPALQLVSLPAVTATALLVALVVTLRRDSLSRRAEGWAPAIRPAGGSQPRRGGHADARGPA